MGCCYSFFCSDVNASETGEPNERTHLLIDPVSNSNNLQRVNSEDLTCRISFALPKKTDEQSSLNRILQDTARNMIDVAALDSNNLQHHEFKERMKIYNGRVHHFLGNNRYRFQKKPTLILQDIPNLENVLNSVPIDAEDMSMIIQAVSAASSAISDIKIEHKEDPVVPFGLT